MVGQGALTLIAAIHPPSSIVLAPLTQVQKW